MALRIDRAAWDRWYRRVLPSYWIFLFCSTHLPQLRIDVPVPESDKLAHLAAFALLAFLFWRFGQTLVRPLSGRFVWLAASVLIAYAGLDEYLQQFVGRTTDLRDWLCDAAGIVPVLVLLEWHRRVRTARAGAVSTPSAP